MRTTPEPSQPAHASTHCASRPEEIAEVIACLASLRASYITGTTIAAEGGRSAI